VAPATRRQVATNNLKVGLTPWSGVGAPGSNPWGDPAHGLCPTFLPLALNPFVTLTTLMPKEETKQDDQEQSRPTSGYDLERARRTSKPAVDSGPLIAVLGGDRVKANPEALVITSGRLRLTNSVLLTLVVDSGPSESPCLLRLPRRFEAKGLTELVHPGGGMICHDCKFLRRPRVRIRGHTAKISLHDSAALNRGRAKKSQNAQDDHEFQDRELGESHSFDLDRRVTSDAVLRTSSSGSRASQVFFNRTETAASCTNRACANFGFRRSPSSTLVWGQGVTVLHSDSFY